MSDILDGLELLNQSQITEEAGSWREAETSVGKKIFIYGPMHISKAEKTSNDINQELGINKETGFKLFSQNQIVGETVDGSTGAFVSINPEDLKKISAKLSIPLGPKPTRSVETSPTHVVEEKAQGGPKGAQDNQKVLNPAAPIAKPNQPADEKKPETSALDILKLALKAKGSGAPFVTKGGVSSDAAIEITNVLNNSNGDKGATFTIDSDVKSVANNYNVQITVTDGKAFAKLIEELEKKSLATANAPVASALPTAPININVSPNIIVEAPTVTTTTTVSPTTSATSSPSATAAASNQTTTTAEALPSTASVPSAAATTSPAPAGVPPAATTASGPKTASPAPVTSADASLLVVPAAPAKPLPATQTANPSIEKAAPGATSGNVFADTNQTAKDKKAPDSEALIKAKDEFVAALRVARNNEGNKIFGGAKYVVAVDNLIKASGIDTDKNGKFTPDERAAFKKVVTDALEENKSGLNFDDAKKEWYESHKNNKNQTITRNAPLVNINFGSSFSGNNIASGNTTISNSTVNSNNGNTATTTNHDNRQYPQHNTQINGGPVITQSGPIASVPMDNFSVTQNMKNALLAVNVGAAVGNGVSYSSNDHKITEIELRQELGFNSVREGAEFTNALTKHMNLRKAFDLQPGEKISPKQLEKVAEEAGIKVENYDRLALAINTPPKTNILAPGSVVVSTGPSHTVDMGSYSTTTNYQPVTNLSADTLQQATIAGPTMNVQNFGTLPNEFSPQNTQGTAPTTPTTRTRGSF